MQEIGRDPCIQLLFMCLLSRKQLKVATSGSGLQLGSICQLGPSPSPAMDSREIDDFLRRFALRPCVTFAWNTLVATRGDDRLNIRVKFIDDLRFTRIVV